MEFKLLFFVLLIVAIACAEPKSYEGYKVYKIVPKTTDEVETLLRVKISGVSEFWDESVDVNQNVKITVSPAHEAELIEILQRDNIEATLVIDDVQRAIDDQVSPVSRRKGSSGGRPSGGSSISGRPGSTGSSSIGKGTTGSNGFLTYYAFTSASHRNRRTYQRNADILFSFTWDRYHTLDSIYSWLDELAEAFPNIVKTVVMPGQSVEGREIKGIIIDYYPERTEKKIGMFEGGLHAREWISPATVTWIIKEFLASDDPEVVALATSFEWHIFPVVNPDGYSYTFTDRRMWRKNRSKANFTSCEASGVEDDMSNGVDLNRNFDFEWNTAGTSEDPCSNLFPGPSPASEPETQAIQQYVLNLWQQGEIIYYIAFHSYSQLIVVPYSHLNSNWVLQIPDFAKMFEIAVRAADALASRNGTTYRVGLSADVMYLMSGTSFDWVKSNGVPVSYLIELRDVGEYGFLLPAEEIIQNNLEIMDALVEMDRATRDLNIYTRESSAGTVVTSVLLVAFGVVITVIYYNDIKKHDLNAFYLCVIKTYHTYSEGVKMVFKVIALLGLLVIANAMVSYENYKVYNIVPKSEAEVQILNDLKKDGYEFWTEIFEVGSVVRIMVAPVEDEEFSSYVKSVNLDAKVSIANVQELIDAQLKTAIPNANSRSSTLGGMSWDRYYGLDNIYNWLDELETLYPNVVTTVNIGTTFEGRQIRAIVIDFKPGQRGERPLTAMIEAGIHAREWISPATATWIIKEFLTSDDPAVRSMAETFVWHIIPVANPDGYAYTFTNNRMWRKNRNTANHVMCGTNADAGNGIDLNRNFNFQWMVIGASSNPCDETYAGPSAASERETQAISNYVLTLQTTSEIIYYLDFHSYAQMILIPYSHVSGIDVLQAPNYGDMFEVAIRAADKLEARHGTPYTVGTSLEILYAVTGSSFDWVKGVVGVPIVYLFELRDVGLYGFLLPPEDIIPNNEEIMDALIELDRATRQLGYYTGAGTVFSSVMSLVISACMLVLLQ
ncbi:uncharacterized protein LOC134748516 [Cydia strobilella]|uniref:uncharacterized protein LOC134748516 n=1 Tax=Cydia strobilella TaxID=1100964 RepID=UPI003003B639